MNSKRQPSNRRAAKTVTTSKASRGAQTRSAQASGPIEEQDLHLFWEGRRIYRSRTPIPRVLERDGRLSVGGDVDNLVVEGDNLQALVSLRSQYNAMVDVVYIDPPYNRGGNDFRYSDARYHDPNADGTDAEYVSNEDSGRHTKWLNYMAPRLYMIREMMADHGVVFVSISDIEMFRLGMLMDEIFDERNRIGVIAWRGSTDNNPSRIAIEHEYILCYAKRISEVPPSWTSPEDEIKGALLQAFDDLKATHDTLPALQRAWNAVARENKSAIARLGRYNKVDEQGPYQVAYRVHNPNPGGYRYDVIHPKSGKPCRIPLNGYRFPEKRMKELIAGGQIIFPNTHDKIVQMKDYLSDYRGTLRSVINLDARKGSYTLKSLFGKNFEGFKNPKPVELIELLVGAAGNSDALVLDAFAGSGTTAHAVMRLNRVDRGRRRFILIEEGNGEDRYARTLIVPRLKKAAKLEGLECGFSFMRTGKELDREAILGLERAKIVSVICQTDRTGTGGGIKTISGKKYVIGCNRRKEAIALHWLGRDQSNVTGKIVNEGLREG